MINLKMSCSIQASPIQYGNESLLLRRTRYQLPVHKCQEQEKQEKQQEQEFQVHTGIILYYVQCHATTNQDGTKLNR
jgi:hypothetical protein